MDLLAVLIAFSNLLLCLSLLRASSLKSIVYWFGNWFPRGHMVIGIGFLVDPVAATLALVAAFLTVLALIFSWGSMESGQNHYQPLMLIFLAAMTGFCFTADLFNLFVFFELMSTTAFALCGLKIEEPAPLQGSFNFAVTNTVGAFFSLTGIGLLYGATGALNMAQMGSLLRTRHDSLVLTASVFLLSGFLIKGAVVPFHFWLPDAHSVSPTPVCVLFSGLMVELGLFAILRVSIVIFGSTFNAGPNPLKISFLVLGALTALWGGVMSFAEHHLKRILAFSTISHAGAMLFALGIGTRAAIAGWLIYVVAHAMIKSGLFFTAGILLHRLRTMSEPALFARASKLTFTGWLWLLGGCGLAGLPPFATALGEGIISDTGNGLIASAAKISFFLSGSLTAGAVLRVFLRVFCGLGDNGPSDRSSQVDELPETHKGNQSIPLHLFGPAALCTLCGGALALIPSIKSFALSAASRMVSQSGYINLIYARPTAVQRPAALLHVSLLSIFSHGLLAFGAACILAAWAVFYQKVPRRFRWPSRLEGRMSLPRQLQSGQPADYVVWIMVGVAAFGSIVFVLR
ncbi:MAG: complex I subunit 5 family protein [Terracidiphilus sp.]